MYPDNFRYTKEHEWVLADGDAGTIGITDHAQQELGDIVYIELPAVGKDVKKELINVPARGKATVPFTFPAAADRTVLMVEHNLSVVADLSDRITVLTRGRILAEGDYQNVSLYVNAGDTIDVTAYGAPYDGNTQADISISVPEPATLSLLALGGLAVLRQRRK